MKTHALPVLMVSLCALAAPLHAVAAIGPDQGQGQGQEQHQRHQPPAGPPPEALEACKGKTAGATTTLKTPDGRTISGSCQLVFRPDRPPMGNGNPPPER